MKHYIVSRMKIVSKKPDVATNDIYHLVARMSVVEHKAFQDTYFSKNAEESTLLYRLFYLIAEQGVRENSSAIQLLGIKNAAQFSTLKKQLSEQVLDTIAFCRRKNTAKIQHHFCQMKLEILLEDQNYSLARRVYKRHFADIEALGAYSWCLHLLRFRKRLLQAENDKKSLKELRNIDAEIEQCIDFALTDRLLEKTYTDLLQIKAEAALRMHPKQKEAVKKLRNKLVQLADSASKTAHLNLRFVANKAEVCYLLQDFGRCRTLVKIGIDLLQNSNLIIANPDAVLFLANTSFYNAFACNDVQEAKRLLTVWKHKFECFESHSRSAKRWMLIAFNAALKIAHKTANYEDVAKLLITRKTIESTARKVLPDEESMSVLASIAISLFTLDDFLAAEHLLAEIIEMNHSILREDMLYFTLIFQLLIYYEQKAWYRLDTAAEAAYHFLYSRRKMRPFEKELMSFFKQMPSFRAKGTLTDAIRIFLQKLETYRNNPIQRLYFLYFNYYDWLQSKLAGEPYREYKKRLLTIPKD